MGRSPLSQIHDIGNRSVDDGVRTHMGRPHNTNNIRTRRGRLAGLSICAVLALTACGGDGQDDSASQETSADFAVDSDMEAAEPRAAEEQTGGSDTTETPLLEGRQFIYNVGLTVQTSNVDATADAIRRIAAENGGAVTGSDVSIQDARDDGSIPGGGQIVVRVEPADLDQLVAELDGAGFVTRLSQDAQDVTEQLVDLDIRIRQAETSVERVEALLAEATELGDVFAIETELTNRQTTLEQLRAQQRATDDLVALATVTIQIEYRTPAAIEEATDGSEGIVDGLRTGWDAFVGAVFVMGYVLAVSAPFVLVGLLVLFIAARLGRRWSARASKRREARRMAADRPGTPSPQVVPYPGTQPPPPVVQPRPSPSSVSGEAQTQAAAATDTITDDETVE